MAAYIDAVINKNLHYTELDKFIVDAMEEWATLNITDETPSNAQERVFWHLMHEVSSTWCPSIASRLVF